MANRFSIFSKSRGGSASALGDPQSGARASKPAASKPAAVKSAASKMKPSTSKSATAKSTTSKKNRLIIGQRRLAFAPTAWVCGVGGVLALWAGWKFGWIELTAVGVIALVALLAAGVMTVGRSSYRVELSLGEQQVKVGERAFGRIDVENVGRRRVWPSSIELPVGQGRAEFALPFLAPGRAHDELFVVPTRRRAVIDVGPVKSVRSDPLGMVRREVVWTGVEKLFVHPQTVLLRGAAAGVLRDLEGQTLRTVSDNDMNFHALREYVPGDDMRSIHWKSSARNQHLMVRQFEDTRRTHTALLLETDQARWADEDSFELGVSVFASLGVNTIRGGMERSFFAGNQSLRSTTPQGFLDETAGIAISPVPELSSAAEKVARDAADCSLALVVMGAQMQFNELQGELAYLPAGLRAVYVQCEVGLEPSVHTVGQVSFVCVGDLEQLPKVMRSAVVS